MEISTDRDQELATAATGGDRNAFEILMRSSQQAVFSLACRLTKNESEADDITQETFISAWKHIGSFRGEIPFKAWVLKITLNKCRSFWRWSNIRRLVSLDQDTDRPDEQSLHETIPDKNLPQPDKAFESLDHSEKITRALNALSLKQREAAILRGQGLEIREIAAIMKTAQGTIKAHLFEARRKLALTLREGL